MKSSPVVVHGMLRPAKSGAHLWNAEFMLFAMYDDVDRRCRCFCIVMCFTIARGGESRGESGSVVRWLIVVVGCFAVHFRSETY